MVSRTSRQDISQAAVELAADGAQSGAHAEPLAAARGSTGASSSRSLTATASAMLRHFASRNGAAPASSAPAPRSPAPPREPHMAEARDRARLQPMPPEANESAETLPTRRWFSRRRGPRMLTPGWVPPGAAAPERASPDRLRTGAARHRRSVSEADRLPSAPANMPNFPAGAWEATFLYSGRTARWALRSVNEHLRRAAEVPLTITCGEDLAKLKQTGMRPQSLRLSGTFAADDLAGLPPSLRHIDLSECRGSATSSAGLKYLADLPLSSLNAAHTGIDDEGARILASMRMRPYRRCAAYVRSASAADAMTGGPHRSVFPSPPCNALANRPIARSMSASSIQPKPNAMPAPAACRSMRKSLACCAPIAWCAASVIMRFVWRRSRYFANK